MNETLPITDYRLPIANYQLPITDYRSPSTVTAWYEGICPKTGTQLRLPRTELAEAIAHSLMNQLAGDDRYALEGKMYGVLLVEDASGEKQVLTAFSGLLLGQEIISGWVPPIDGRDRIKLAEMQTLQLLDQIKQEILSLQQMPERQQYEVQAQEFAAQLQQLNLWHRERKRERQHQRQAQQNLTETELELALEALNDQSRQDGIERRQLKQKRDAVLVPLKQQIDRADDRIQFLKRRRKAISNQLQQQMHAAYQLTNFAGDSLPLQQLRAGLPTGTGDCCAPKLLHYAATHDLKPLAMAEFWWGRSIGDKQQGEFYEACADRCQPILGFLLSGLPPVSVELSEQNSRFQVSSDSLPILHEDDWIIAVDKPAGLLSVPGRTSDRQDSVLSRLRLQLGTDLWAVHRLDQDTSGVLLLAKSIAVYRDLSQQFQQRQTHKVYEAILSGVIDSESGTIDLPLWGNPVDRPRQQVDWQRGKSSLTQFRVLARTENRTRIELVPLTGRTHQLRVHAADVNGLNTPIVGDRLYGGDIADRLYLHAKELQIYHPRMERTIELMSPIPNSLVL